MRWAVPKLVELEDPLPKLNLKMIQDDCTLPGISKSEFIFEFTMRLPHNLLEISNHNSSLNRHWSIASNSSIAHAKYKLEL
jgi:hypothetical protein